MDKQKRSKTFLVEDAQSIFDKLKNFYDKNQVQRWQEKALLDINELFSKYQVTEFWVNKNSYMGIVIDCLSLTYGDIFIKIVPPMIERFDKEVAALKLLSPKLTCKFYEENFEKSALVMEKILPGDLVEFYPNQLLVRNLFEQLYNTKTIVDENINQKFMDFDKIVLKDYNLCKKSIKTDESVDFLYHKFCEVYQKISKNAPKYLLHGDVYKNNMVLSKNGVKVIDPLGFIAPFVMELVSICAYEMFYNDEYEPTKILNDFIDFFHDYTDDVTYRNALFCELVKVYIPSLYEANDGGIRAKKWLDLIEKLYFVDFKKGGNL